MAEPWWKRLPGRLLEEEAALAALYEEEVRFLRSHRWTRQDGEPRLALELAIGSRTIPLQVGFPAHYPEGCPSMWPTPHQSLSSHQFVRSGVLCLELGPDNWHPEYLVADLVRSAWRLIASETISELEPIDIPSRHEPSLAERIRSAKAVLIESSSFDRLVAAATASCRFEWGLGRRGGWRLFPVAFPEGVPVGDVPPAVAGGAGRFQGSLVLLKESAPSSIPIEEPAFEEFVKQHGENGYVPEPPGLVLLRAPGGQLAAYLRLKERVLEVERMPLLTESTPRVPERLRQRLSELTFAVVGVGSVGSRVALSLRRAGAERFVLVDGDVLEGPNVCRFPAGYTDVGAAKVELVGELLRESSPAEPTIVTNSIPLVTATNPVLHAEVVEKIAAADILIDATANPEVFGLMAMIASDHRRPLLWAEVFAGGLGGLVAWAQPERSPCPRCVRAGFLATLHEWPPAPRDEGATPYATSDEEPISATDADVSFIAACLVQRVLEIAQDRASTQAVTLIGFREGWVFQSSMHTIPVPVRLDDWSCPRCWQADSEPDPELAARAENLFADGAHADDPAPA